MQENEKVADIWKWMKKQCEVSDVLVLNRDGEITALFGKYTFNIHLYEDFDYEAHFSRSKADF